MEKTLVLMYESIVSFSKKRTYREMKKGSNVGSVKKHGNWITKNTFETKHPIIRLHNEILDFFNYVSLTRAEINKRERAIAMYFLMIYNRIKSHAKSLWPTAKVEAFGSFATNLSLPDSDIDIAIVVNDQTDSKNMIKRLSQHFKENDLVVEEEEILSARVPLLKIIEKSTLVNIDISFNVVDGVKAVEIIKQLNKKYPPLRPLIITIKAFLKERRLNETYKGGIGSFLLIVMMVGFIQHFSKQKKLRKTNLGELLIGFFKFYGSDFNYQDLGLSIIGEGSLYKKPAPDLGLSVENPQNQDIDLGKGVRQYKNVIKSFQFALDILKYTSGSLADLIHLYPDRKAKNQSN